MSETTKKWQEFDINKVMPLSFLGLWNSWVCKNLGSNRDSVIRHQRIGLQLSEYYQTGCINSIPGLVLGVSVKLCVFLGFN